MIILNIGVSLYLQEFKFELLTSIVGVIHDVKTKQITASKSDNT